jgi:tetratricopeptide (TPR) repeat protein/O-antigen ligase
MRQRRKRDKTVEGRAGVDWPGVFGQGALIGVVLVVPIIINRGSTNICDVKDVALGLIALAGVSLWLVASLARGRLSWAESRLNLLVLLFAAWAGLTLIYSRYRFATVSEFGRLAAHVGLYGLVILSLRQIGQVRRIVGFACLAAVPVCIYGFIQAAGKDQIRWDQSTTRVFSFLGNATYLASFLVLLLPLAVAVAWPREEAEGDERPRRRSRPLRRVVSVLFFLAAAMMGLCLYFSVTISPVLGLGLGAAMVVLLVIVRAGRSAWRAAAWGLLMGAVALAVLGLLGYRYLPKNQQRRVQQILHLQDPFGRMRKLQWKAALYLWTEQPLLGRGYGTYRIYSLERMAQEWYADLGRPADKMFVPSYAHNEYLQVLAGTGAVGGTVFLALLLTVYAGALRVALRHPTAEWRRIGLGVVAGLTAFLVQNFFGVTFRQTGAVTLFWLWLGFVAVASAQLPAPGRGSTGMRVREVRFRAFNPGRLGVVAVVLGCLLAAIAWFTIRPVKAHLLAKRAEAAGKIGQFKVAAQLADEAIKLSPYSFQPYYISAYAWGQQGDYEKALEANAKALELLPENASVYYNLGVTYKELGRFEEAEASFQRAIELQPTAVHHQAAMGELLLEQRRFEEALSYARAAADLSPEEPRVYLLLADIEGRRGNLRETVKHLQRAAKLSPNDINVWRQLAELLVRQRRYSEAIRPCRSWARLDPNSLRAYYLLGNCYYSTRRYEEAKDAFLRALEIAPDFVQARLNLAYSYGRLHQYERAHQELERVIRTAPDSASARSARALLRKMK